MFFLLFFFLFWFVAPIIAVIYYYVIRKKPTPSPDVEEVVEEANPRDKEWLNYLSKQLRAAKTNAEKQLIQNLISNNPFTTEKPAETTKPVAQIVAEKSVQELKTPKKPLDTTLLLLYFGAFLFVASAGLFIAFSGFSGTIRTISLAIVMLVMYTGGLYLYANKKSLQQAGVSFTAIGMAIAPLLGLAAYNFMFDKTNGAVIWFATSVLCIALYLYALFKIRNSFIGYLFIFSFISLFQSGVAITNAPTYYFIWILLATAIMLRLFVYIKRLWPQLLDSSTVSARIMAPLSIFTSLILINSQGKWQLSFTLLIAGAYYLTEALIDVKNRQDYLDIGHVLVLSAISTGAFAYREEWRDVAFALSLSGLLHLIIIIFTSAKASFIKYFSDIALIAAIVAPIFGYQNKPILLASILLAIVLGIAVTAKQQRTDSYVYAGAFFIALPIVIGQYVVEPRLDWFLQALINCAALITLIAIRKLVPKTTQDYAWNEASTILIAGGAMSTLAFALVANFWPSLLVHAIVALLFVYIGVSEKQKTWTSIAGFVFALPVWQSVFIAEQNYFLVATSIALIANIVLALLYHLEANRWLGSLLWFILPISLYVSNFDITVTQLAWLYALTTIGFIVARGIALGELFVAGSAPLSSFTKNTSTSYVVGYVLSAITALSIMPNSSNARLHFSLMLGVVSVLASILAIFIEKNKDILAIVPILVQLIILCAFGFLYGGVEISYAPTMIISFSVALLLYAISSYYQLNSMRVFALITSYTPAALYFSEEITRAPMPVFLMLAGLLTLYDVRKKSQGNKELAGLVVVAGAMWQINYLGVDVFQAYSHIIAATFALYAYLRNRIKDYKTSDQYLYIMFGSATIPLIIQAIGGVSGDVYGWWLLIEQVFFMLLGMLIKKRFLVTWGLYVSIASVLYQLRDLQWAALTVLALFIIGFAVYQINKQEKNKQV